MESDFLICWLKLMTRLIKDQLLPISGTGHGSSEKVTDLSNIGTML